MVKAAFSDPMNGTDTIKLARDKRGHCIQRVVFSVVLGVAASGCYGGIAVEPRHEPRIEKHHEERIEERREEPRQERRDKDDDEHHHEGHHDDDHHD
jgi:hypothetical protein